MNDTEELHLEYKSSDCDLESSLEALIFVSREPLTIERMFETLTSSGIKCDVVAIKQAMASLCAKWRDQKRTVGRGMVLEKIGGGFIFATSPLQSAVVSRIAQKKPVELTKSQIEILSIVAYRQPITRVDIDEIRGVDSSNALKRLMQFKLLKILGKSEGLGRPLLYGTTKHFLEFFSLNSLNDLPTLKQFESLGQGDEPETIDLEHEGVSLKDLFADHKNGSMFSKDVQRLSDEALKSLDEALVRMESVEKISGEK